MREMGIVLFSCLLLLTTSLTCGYAVITRESPLSLGQTLSSPGGSYELGFFSPNNSQYQYLGIWFKKVTPRVVVWVANREKPVTNHVANLTISRNGCLILLDSKKDIVWSTRKPSTSNKCHAKLLDTGNLVVISDVSGNPLWQSFDNLGDTMLPRSSLMYNLATGGKRVLTSWKSQSDPSPGDFVIQIMPQVPAQVFTMRGSTPYGRSGPWAKTKFSGVPLMDESYASPFSISQDVGNGTGYFSYLQRNSELARVIITSEGSTKLFRYNGTGWSLGYESPKESCDLYGACGPFGLCVTSIPTKCNCIKGFVPKSMEEWKQGNTTSGCVRRTKLSCQENTSTKTQRKGTDVFYRMSNVKPPDFYEYTSFVDSDECKQGCLNNCSCTAFSYITGIGCLLWYQELMDTVKYSIGGESLSIRLASSELAGSRRTMIIAGGICLSIIVILALASYKYWRYRVKQNEISQDSWKNGLEPGLTFFEMNTVRSATDNFSASNKLGQGGFGPVYKGKLLDRKEIAVKRLSSSSGQGTEEFMNEIKLISKLQHRNLVRLLGCCIDGEEKLLIYEFLANKSLDTFLFDLTLKLQIDWPKRFNIIQGVARGLLYLHRDSCLRVIHRDLKVSNVLLDQNMNPKISDFGLARMFQGTHHQDNTHRVVGTIGYMSPEYAWTGTFSEKSDIYAFGVLLLEIISGKKISRFSCGEEGKTLVEYAWESWCKTGGVDLLDQDISSSCSPAEVARCVQIGLLCIQQQAIDRPNIAKVVSMITTAVDIPRPKKPVFALHIQNQESGVSVSESLNDLTQTAIHGR